MTKTYTLAGGTVLHHGTASQCRFKAVDSPAWFALRWKIAAQWAGWQSKQTGVRRVYSYVLGRDTVLRDTRSLADWRRLCAEVCGGDQDPILYDAAAALKARRMPGWFGRAEVMLTDASVLTLLEVKLVGPDVIPYGR